MAQAKILILPILASLIIGGCTHTTPANNPTPTPAPTITSAPSNQSDVLFDNSNTNTGTMPAPEAYTMAQVAAHNTPPGDCWLVIEGTVYNVSNFAESGHPGGTAIYQGCGTDATTLFNTRPMGSGTPHSQQARSLLPNFKIGTLSQE